LITSFFAGCANFKHDLAKKLDTKVNEKILAFVDVQYGGEMGFQQAIELSSSFLTTSKFLGEQRILQNFFDQIARDGTYCYSALPTVNALEQGSVQTLIVWEDLPDIRYELRSSLPNEQGEYEKKIVFKPTPTCEFQGYEVVNSCPLLDWIIEHSREFGATIEVISSSTSVANQFIEGFGGVGGILRYKVEQFEFVEEANESESEYEYEY